MIGRESYKNEDLNVLNFERIKWGGLRHGDLLYTLFDLEQFTKEEIPEPVTDDIEILAFIGVLTPKSCNRPEPSKHDWTYATYWRGEDGYDKDIVEMYFGKYL